MSPINGRMIKKLLVYTGLGIYSLAMLTVIANDIINPPQPPVSSTKGPDLLLLTAAM